MGTIFSIASRKRLASSPEMTGVSLIGRAIAHLFLWVKHRTKLNEIYGICKRMQRKRGTFSYVDFQFRLRMVELSARLFSKNQK
jgi:hypothetical protein